MYLRWLVIGKFGADFSEFRVSHVGSSLCASLDLAASKYTVASSECHKTYDTLEKDICQQCSYVLYQCNPLNIEFEGAKHEVQFFKQRSQYTYNVSENFDDEVNIWHFPDVICGNLLKLSYTNQ